MAAAWEYICNDCDEGQIEKVFNFKLKFKLLIIFFIILYIGILVGIFIIKFKDIYIFLKFIIKLIYI